MPPNYLPEPFRHALVVAALLSIVGCGGERDNKSNDTGSGSTPTVSTDSVDSPKVDSKTIVANPDSQARHGQLRHERCGCQSRAAGHTDWRNHIRR